MFKLLWVFGLVFLFFVFLYFNTVLTKNIKTIESKVDKTKKDRISLLILKGLDFLFGLILLLYFFVVVLTMLGLFALLMITLFN